jgi:hypothetical protein
METRAMPARVSDDDEAVNILSLGELQICPAREASTDPARDGGGVRGVSTLVILDAIMTEIKDLHGLAETPRPCDYFHMIAGTNTGG